MLWGEISKVSLLLPPAVPGLGSWSWPRGRTWRYWTSSSGGAGRRPRESRASGRGRRRGGRWEGSCPRWPSRQRPRGSCEPRWPPPSRGCRPWRRGRRTVPGSAWPRPPPCSPSGWRGRWPSSSQGRPWWRSLRLLMISSPPRPLSDLPRNSARNSLGRNSRLSLLSSLLMSSWVVSEWTAESFWHSRLNWTLLWGRKSLSIPIFQICVQFFVLVRIVRIISILYIFMYIWPCWKKYTTF